MKAWILHKIDLLHAISCRDIGNVALQTSFEEFQISQCTTNFQLIHFVLRLPSSISPSSLLSKQDLFPVAFFGLPGKLHEFSNIRSLTGILHVTSLSIQNVLNCYSPNFDILEISLYTISLKVAFSLLSTVNLFNLNGSVRNNVFNREA